MLSSFSSYLKGLGQGQYNNYAQLFGDIVQIIDIKVIGGAYKDSDLLQMAFGWADDAYNPMGAPIVSTDSAAFGTGFLITFTRSYYGTTFSSRDKIANMGYGWDNNWNWKLETQSNGDLVLKGPHGVERKFQKDARIIALGRLMVEGVEVNTNTYVSAYNDDGVMKKVGNEYVLTEQSGSVLIFNADGSLKSIMDVNGNLVAASYDALGRIFQLTHVNEKLPPAERQFLRISYDSRGRIDKVENSLGYVTNYAYNSSDQLIRATYSDGESVSYTYKATSGVMRNAIASVTYASGAKTVYEYNETSGPLYGRLIGGYSVAADGTPTDKLQFKSGTTSTDALVYTYTLDGKEFQKLWYNQKGQVLKSEEIAANGQKITTTYTYDAQGRLTGYKDSIDGFATVNNSATLVYDNDGNISKVVNSQGQNLEFQYNNKYGYVTEIKDALGRATNFTYDDKGNPIATTRADGTLSKLTFDTNGRVVTSANRRDWTTKYEYNDNGTLRKIEIPDHGTPIEYTYDKYMNVKTITDHTGTTTFSYSENGLYLERIDYPDGRYIKYTYDTKLGVKKTIDAGRKVGGNDVPEYHVEYVYNAFGLLKTVKSRVNGVMVTTNEYEYYDASGLLKREIHGNGTMTEYTYVNTQSIPQSFGVLASKIEYKGTEVLAKSEYTYDATGAVQTLTTLDGKWTYTYDKIGQLTKAVFVSNNTTAIPNKTLEYEYDAVGNRIRTRENGGAWKDYVMVDNGMNQYLDDGVYTYEYDKDGNMTSKTEKEGQKRTWHYIWNASGQLVKQIGPDDTYEYRYDALGNRTGMKKNNEDWVNYLIDPSGLGNVLFEYGDAGTMVAYVYGYGLVSQIDTAGNSYYYGFDAQGSTSVLTDASGAVRNQYAYEPFGNTLRSTGTLANSYQYVGQFGVQNNGTGQLYMRARYYDPQTGRFTSEDPVEYYGGDINLYCYCGNDPVNGIDPSGMISTWDAAYRSYGLGRGIYTLWTVSKVANPVWWCYQGYGLYSKSFSALDNIVGISKENQHMTGGFFGDFGRLEDRFISWYYDQNWKDSNHEAENLGRLFDLIFGMPGPKDRENFLGLLKHLDFFYKTYGRLIEPNIDGLMQLFPPGDPVDQKSIPSTVPRDPNQIIGPAGYGDEGYIAITPETVLPYRVEFQNHPSASGSAWRVYFTMDLDEHLDLDSLELTGFGFGNYRFPLSLTKADFGKEIVQTVKAPVSGKMVEVVFRATLNGSRLVFEFLTQYVGSDNPEQGVFVQDGFLAPGGKGYVSYNIKVKQGRIQNGEQITAVGNVQFDTGTPFSTDLRNPNDPNSGSDPRRQCLLTISNDPLGKPMNPDAVATSATSVKLTWENGDAQNRAATYRIERRDEATSTWVYVAETRNLYYNVYGLPRNTEAETEYHFRITAVNSTMNIHSETVEFPSVKTPMATVPAPAKPTGLQTTAQEETSITLAWNAGSSVDSYMLQYSTDGLDWNDVPDVITGTQTLYEHSGLVVGTNYQYRLFAVNQGGMSEASETLKVATATPLPGVPTGLTATARDSNTIFVYWDKSDYATSYKLEFSTNGTTWNEVSTSTITDNAFLHTELEAGKSYSYRVMATNATGDSAVSAVASATTLTALAVPTGLRSTSATDSTITIAWNAVASATDYTLQRKGPGDADFVTVYSGPATSFPDSGLFTETEYQYRVLARNDSGNVSPFSSPESFSTNPTTVVNPPVDFRIDGKTQTSITLAWNAVDDAIGYEVQYRTGTGAWTLIADIFGITCVVPDLDAGTRYEFQVLTVTTAGKSNWSGSVFETTEPLVVNPPTAPENFRSTVQTSNSVTLAWDAQSNLTGYTLQYRVSGTSNWEPWTPAPGTSATSATITGLEAGKDYDFRLTATNAGGSASSITDATTQLMPVPRPDPPTNFAVTTTDYSATLTWDSINDVIYVMQYKKSTDSDWTTASSAMITGLTERTAYNFRIQATNAAGESDWTYKDATTQYSSEEKPTPDTPTFVVTTLEDVVDDADGVLSLREAIALAGEDGGIITFDATLFTSGEMQTITLSTLYRPLWIDSAVTIVGPGSDKLSISSNNQMRVLYIATSFEDVSISGLTIRDGYAHKAGYGGVGAGIYATNTKLTLDDVAFINNSATYGGAICTYYTDLNITNAIFEGNTAETDGGAIWNYGSSKKVTGEEFSITNTEFVNNTAQISGGAIYLKSTANPATIDSSTFESNSAVYGGALYQISGNIEIKGNTKFTANKGLTGEGRGGAIYSAGGDFVISDSIFDSNTSTYAAGIWRNGRAVDVVTLTNVDFIGNTATRFAGAIYRSLHSKDTMTITDSYFENNTAGARGGAIYASSGILEVKGSTTFTGNNAQQAKLARRLAAAKFIINGKVFDGASNDYFNDPSEWL